MTTAVIGSGIMGCCAALEFASRGERVVLFEREAELCSRTSIAGEAKIHLGYVYGMDRSLATARQLIAGALQFEAVLRRLLGVEVGLAPSQPFHYGVLRGGLMSAAEVEGHLTAVHALTRDVPGGYFGEMLDRAPRRLDRDSFSARFCPEACEAVFETGEVAIQPGDLAASLRARVRDEPLIELRLGTKVLGVEEGRGLGLTLQGTAEVPRFDAVVNAAWDGRPTIDRTMGLSPPRRWSFRLKYGIRLPSGSAPEGTVSATFVLGAFGDVVRYEDDSLYLSWYPACKTAVSHQTEPPYWRGRPTAAAAPRILEGSLEALSRLMPPLRGLSAESLDAASIRGGAIFALGQRPIGNPASGLHDRSGIGIVSRGRYHSVDTGKYTMAPAFAVAVADRVLG